VSYSIESRPDDLVIIAIMNEDFSTQHELPGYAEELKNKLDQLPQPSALITDLNSVSASFGDIVTGLSMLTKGELAVLGHPNIRENIVVTTKDLYSLSAKALGQAQYGARRVTVAKTLEEALDYVRQQRVAS
jgi:hypothetical protein